ncbi:MAG: hypothetical protein U9R50_04090, partial [Campylobacterota bacterium]|nr:hypothetical protein [Campylobacterota bacterium]
GQYQFSKVGVDMEVYHLPFTYHFDTHDFLDYFIVGNVGYSRTFINNDIVIPPEGRLDYENHLQTYTAGIGGGIRYKFNDDVSVLGGLEFIYSRSGVSIKNPDDDIGEAIKDFFNKNYNDNLSYKFFTSLEYRPKQYLYKPYATLDFKLYETKSSFTFDTLNSFATQSNVTTLALGIETSNLFEDHGNYLTFEAYFHANYLGGDVVKSVKFDHYGSVGGVAYWYTPESVLWAERFFLELNTIRSDGLEGYNLGIGFTIDF